MSASVHESHALSMACEESGILRVRIRSSFVMIVFPNVLPCPLLSSRDPRLATRPVPEVQQPSERKLP